MKNTVLMLSEGLALPDGARVWVEISPSVSEMFGYVPDGLHIKRDNQLKDHAGALTIGGKGHLAGWFRVWSLPQPPTADELAANPWEVQNDE